MRKFYTAGVTLTLFALSLVLISCANSQGKVPKVPLGQQPSGTVGGLPGGSTSIGGSTTAPAGYNPQYLTTPPSWLLPSYSTVTCVQGDEDYDNFNATVAFSGSQMTLTVQNLDDNCNPISGDPAVTTTYTYHIGAALSSPANSFILDLQSSAGTWVYSSISQVQGQGGGAIQLGQDPGGSTPSARPTTLDSTIYYDSQY
jgi:hypothetical protein